MGGVDTMVLRERAQLEGGEYSGIEPHITVSPVVST